MDFTIVRLLLSIAVQKDWHVHQMDFSNMFLQGTLKREVWMQPPKLLDGVGACKVYLLRKSLYGLRQAPRIWCELLAVELRKYGFEPMQSAPCVFRGNGVIVISYVDDLLVFGTDIAKVEDVKRNLAKNFPAKDMGIAKDFLSMALELSRELFRLVQKKTVTSLLAEVNVANCRPVAPPGETAVDLTKKDGELACGDFPFRRIIGSVLYLAKHTRPYLSVGHV